MEGRISIFFFGIAYFPLPHTNHPPPYPPSPLFLPMQKKKIQGKEDKSALPISSPLPLLCVWELPYLGTMSGIEADGGLVPNVQWNARAIAFRILVESLKQHAESLCQMDKKLAVYAGLPDHIRLLSDRWDEWVPHGLIVGELKYLQLMDRFLRYLFPPLSPVPKRDPVTAALHASVWRRAKTLDSCVGDLSSRVPYSTLSTLRPFLRVDFFGNVVSPLAHTDAKGAYHLGHHHPHAHGGPVSLDNLALVQSSANLSMHDRFTCVMPQHLARLGRSPFEFLFDLKSEVGGNPFRELFGTIDPAEWSQQPKWKIIESQLSPAEKKEARDQLPLLIVLFNSLEDRIARRQAKNQEKLEKKRAKRASAKASVTSTKKYSSSRRRSHRPDPNQEEEGTLLQEFSYLSIQTAQTSTELSSSASSPPLSSSLSSSSSSSSPSLSEASMSEGYVFVDSALLCSEIH